MHMIKSRHAIALAALSSLIVLGGPQAAQGQALPHSPRLAAATTGNWNPQRLPWVRKAIAAAPSRQATPKIPIGDFSACPKLPTGFDPNDFACFLTHITGGQLLIGSTNQIINRNITISFAEGVDPSGNTALIAGVTRSAPMPVLGGIFEDPLVNNIVQTDPNLQLAVKPVGLGIAIDPSGNTVGFISQKIKAVNPVFGSACAVGSRQTPITLAPTFGTTNPPPPNMPISGHVDSIGPVGNELVIIGTLVDNAFAAPGAGGCGPSDSLDNVVDKVGGLPSPAGTNTAIFQVTVEVVGYPFI